MAVSRLWAVHTRLDRVIDYAINSEKTLKSTSEFIDKDDKTLKDVIRYATDSEKTDNELFVDGINCSAPIAREQFVAVKQKFSKTDGVQAYHGYLSFKEQNITPKQAQKIGMEFASRVWGDKFQVVVATHLNTGHLHCHFVINSVSFVDGKKLQGEEKSWFKFRHIADEICRKYNLHVIENPQRKSPDRSLKRVEEKDKDIPTRYNLCRKAIDEAIEKSNRIEQFRYELKQMGYTLVNNPNRKYWNVIPKEYKKPIRLYRLGEQYTEKAIVERISQNKSRVKMVTFQKAKPQYLIATREDRIKKVGGLYGLYLYYCYRLGYFDKQKKKNPARVHYALREDLIKLNKFTEQMTLLARYKISTETELNVRIQSLKDECNALVSKRTKLRNEIRLVGTKTEKAEECKEIISAIGIRLKKMRKEMKALEEVYQRSSRISDNLNIVLKDEEEICRKEGKRHEQQR